MNAEHLLVADIGGTKTTLAVFSQESGPRQPLIEETFPSKDYPSLEAILTAFLADKADAKAHLVEAVFGVAGAVMEGRAQVTNLPWLIDAQSLSADLKFSVRLVNDLEAIASAVPFLTAADLETINPGSAVPHHTIAVIAPGTGLGEAYLTWDGRGYRPHPSEGGHADFAPTTPTELALLTFLQPRFGHVSYERVCSGSGIPNLYEFLRDTGRFAEPDWLKQALASAADPTPIIMQAAQDNKAEIATAVLDLFVSILAGEASNLGLKMLATGGIYLGGGIPPRILSQLKQPTFMATFSHKGRFAKLLSHLPVYVICNPKVALLGAAYHSQQFAAMRSHSA
ncbi:MAG: glucokinase [Aggregatilineales bacterium]